MINAVIFDMDGLMFDTERVSKRAWSQTFRNLGYNLTDELFLAMVGRNEPDSTAIIIDSMGPLFPVEKCRKEANARYAHLLESEGVPLKPGLFDLLDFLKGNDIPAAVATSTPRSLAQHKLTLAGIISRFKVLLAGDEIPRGKPEPDLFLAAARLLGIAPEQCLVLEDSPAGIRAAHAAGMVPVMVPDLIQPDATLRKMAYAIVPTLIEAQKTINGLINRSAS